MKLAGAMTMSGWKLPVQGRWALWMAMVFLLSFGGQCKGLTVTRYQYDEAGNEIAQVDALNRTNSFAYDGMGRKIGHTMPGGQSEGFAYDLAGNEIYQTNYNGAIITNLYDSMNRLTERLYPNGTSNSFTFTATGQRATMDDASGTTTYAYDNRDRVLACAMPAGTLTYGYDADGNMTNITSSTVNGTLLTYQYDALNRLTNVLANGSEAANYNYDLAGNLQALRYGNGVTNLYQYDSLNRLTNLTWKLTTTTLGSFAYQLGLSGNRTNLSETVDGTNRTYAWQYDNLYRLTNENISAIGNVGYGYDAVGNRTNRQSTISQLPTASSTYNTNDWLTSDQYDSNGNTTNSASKPYQYDVENRLTNFNNGQVILVYDADGNRVKKITSTTTTLYLVDTHNPTGYPQVMEELTVSGGSTNLSRAYTWGLSLINQRIPGTSTNYYGFDGHGSTRFLTGLNGSITGTYAYDAFGNVINSTGSTPNDFLYCCYQNDPDVGLVYDNARYLNLNTGRFWTMDSYEGDNEDPLSLHKYLYCEDNPVNNVDPSGHDLADLSLSMSIGASLDSMYNGVVTATGNALQGTIMGVENGYNANQILDEYLISTAAGVAGGILAGKIIGTVDEAVFGSEVEFSGSTAPEARAAVQEVEQNAVNAARQSQISSLARKAGYGNADLMLPIDLREGGYLFSTKAPDTIKNGLWATDELGINMAANSANAYTRGVQIPNGNPTIYVYKIKTKTSGAFGYARANSQIQGPPVAAQGSFPQYYIRQQDIGNLEELPNDRFHFSQQ